MSNNTPVTIEKSANGFIVKPYSGTNTPVPADQIFVFATAADLTYWLNGHFAPQA